MALSKANVRFMAITSGEKVWGKLTGTLADSYKAGQASEEQDKGESREQLASFSGQTPDFTATHAAVATVAPFPAWRGSQGLRCAGPGI